MTKLRFVYRKFNKLYPQRPLTTSNTRQTKNIPFFSAFPKRMISGPLRHFFWFLPKKPYPEVFTPIPKHSVFLTKIYFYAVIVITYSNMYDMAVQRIAFK